MMDPPSVVTDSKPLKERRSSQGSSANTGVSSTDRSKASSTWSRARSFIEGDMRASSGSIIAVGSTMRGSKGS